MKKATGARQSRASEASGTSIGVPLVTGSPSEALGYCARIALAMSILGGRSKAGLKIVGHSLHGFATTELQVRTPADPNLLPPRLLELLEGDQPGWHIRVAPSLSELGSTGRHRLHVLFARWRRDVAFIDRRHQVTPASAADVAAKLSAFDLAPTFTVDAGPEFAACWQLAAPLDTSMSAGLARARVAQERLAGAVGAQRGPIADDSPVKWDASDPEHLIPIAGVIRNMGARGPLVTIPTINPGHQYSLDEIERAIEETTIHV